MRIDSIPFRIRSNDFKVSETTRENAASIASARIPVLCEIVVAFGQAKVELPSPNDERRILAARVERSSKFVHVDAASFLRCLIHCASGTARERIVDVDLGMG